MLLLSVVGGLAICIYALRKYRESQWGICKSCNRMEGKVIIITGSNSGIGKETARDLARRGAVVILACRNKENAQNAIKDIRCSTGNGDLIYIELDLGNFESIKKCASIILEKFPRIDVLVNNAGVFIPPEDKAVTSDGVEAHFGINHLGHFLFTNLLLGRLKQTDDSRIVIVSSMMHKFGQIDFETLGSSGNVVLARDRKGRNPLYSDSKLCNILHAQELKKRLQGSKTSVFVLCPGLVYSGLFRLYGPKYNILQKLCFLPIAIFFMRSTKQGAQTPIYCAVSEEVKGVPFGYFRDCKMAELDYPLANDASLASRLWDFSSSFFQKK